MALLDQLDRDGYILMSGVYADEEACRLIGQMEDVFQNVGDDSRAVRSRAGRIYAARNVQAFFPAVTNVWQRVPLISLLHHVLGTDFGLVRVLYFDKPPEQSWSLAWHKDLTIAVQRNDLPTTHFRNPTTKAGVAHVEAPRSLLESMLTLRIHLDACTEENGPLAVIPGSHCGATDDAAREMQTILANRGDVLAMRPLISHSSTNSRPGTAHHRRILHLEFSGQRELPDGYRWHDFRPSGPESRSNGEVDGRSEV